MLKTESDNQRRAIQNLIALVWENGRFMVRLCKACRSKKNLKWEQMPTRNSEEGNAKFLDNSHQGWCHHYSHQHHHNAKNAGRPPTDDQTLTHTQDNNHAYFNSIGKNLKVSTSVGVSVRSVTKVPPFCNFQIALLGNVVSSVYWCLHVSSIKLWGMRCFRKRSA